MSTPTFLFGQYQKDENELARKIKQISSGLGLLSQLITHGKIVAPLSGQDLRAYKRMEKNRLKA